MRLFTVKEAAKVLRCSEVKLYEVIRQNQIRPIRHIGKKIVIPEVSLNAYILGVDLDVNAELLKSLSA